MKHKSKINQQIRSIQMMNQAVGSWVVFTIEWVQGRGDPRASHLAPARRLSGDTIPCRMTRVTLQSDIRFKEIQARTSGHPTRGCIPRDSPARATSVVGLKKASFSGPWMCSPRAPIPDIWVQGYLDKKTPTPLGTP